MSILNLIFRWPAPTSTIHGFPPAVMDPRKTLSSTSFISWIAFVRRLILKCPFLPSTVQILPILSWAVGFVLVGTVPAFKFFLAFNCLIRKCLHPFRSLCILFPALFSFHPIKRACLWRVFSSAVVLLLPNSLGLLCHFDCLLI